MEHFKHKHPLSLSKYNHSPPHAVCSACADPILLNTDFYRCIHQSNAPRNSPCARFLLHKACADLPIIIHHPFYREKVLSLWRDDGAISCFPCHESVGRWIYVCDEGENVQICIKCAFVERELNHPSHSHTLTLLPLKATLHTCTACGTQGSQDYSYLCKTCLFWIHKRCAYAPRTLIRQDHANDHPLVLAYSLPEDYRIYGVSCYLCFEKIYWRDPYWLYYCSWCRYFAHVHCALSAESRKHGDENDLEGSDLVNFPICDDQPYLFYELIQQFAKKFSISMNEESRKANLISQCRSGHSLILFDNFNDKSVVQTNICGTTICDGCVQPLLVPSEPFYGCLDCNFFLHTLCAAELPREIQHASHTGNELSRWTRCYETSKPLSFYICGVCRRYCNGVVYYDESNKYWVDVLCASLPSKIKHDCHKHTLHHHLNETSYIKRCKGCYSHISGHSFACITCDYYIHVKCALKKGKIKHRWDDHHLSLMYPPVKGHPHAFNCEFCSEDINPNYWFYHCPKCDTSFHAFCVDQDEYSNIKYGGTVKDDNLHQHPIQLKGTRQKFKCAKCGERIAGFYIWKWNSPRSAFYTRKPFIECASCEFFICMYCIDGHYGAQPELSMVFIIDKTRWWEMSS